MPGEPRRDRGALPSRVGRHRRDSDGSRLEPTGFTRSVATLEAVAGDGASVSVHAVDLGTGQALVSIDEEIVLPASGVGVILLLVEVSARMSGPGAAGYGILERTPEDLVGGSGLWQHLQAPVLPLVDLAVLVGATRDNLATNVLLRHVGLDAVRARGESLGLSRTALLDRVRDSRGPDDAPHSSVGSTVDCTDMLTALSRGRVVDEPTSARVLEWLGGNVDLSLVASGLALDPLAHRTPDRGIRLINTTGTDVDVRSDVGLLYGPRAEVVYAITIQFADTSRAARLSVHDAMRVFGQDLLGYVA